jgi:stress response protein SCP2
MLQMQKGQSLDLNKEAGSVLTKLRLGAGWDVADGKTVDLDLWLIPKGGAPVYFNNKSIPGATLDKDDRTGASSAGGADENIQIDAAALANEEYTVAINIYDAKNKGQFFRDVKRAFVEVEDTVGAKKILNYDITANGGDNYTLVVGKITKKDGGLTFTAHEEFSTKDMEALCKECGASV